MVSTSQIIHHMENCIISALIYLFNALSLNKGGALIINSILALGTTKILGNYFNIIMDGSPLKDILMPIVIGVFSLVFFLFITAINTLYGTFLARKMKNIKINLLYSEMIMKVFCFVFICFLSMSLTILCSMLSSYIIFSGLYPTMLMWQVVFFLLCIGFELNSFNRNVKILNGKGFKAIDIFSSIANFIAIKTMINRLSTFDVSLTEQEKQELKNKLKD